MKTGVIYIIRNTVNDKVYIGQTTTNTHTRFMQHCKKSVLATRHYKLYNAIKKYGKDKFYIEELETNIPVELLNEKEISYVAKFNSFRNGYNSTTGGDGRTINNEYDEAKIVELYKRGKTLKEIGVVYGVSETTISRVLERLKVPTRPDGRKYDNFGEKFVEMWNEGISIPKMAKEFNVHERTIRRHSLRLKLKPRGRGFKPYYLLQMSIFDFMEENK